ncbi:hypothetical protein L9F63_016954, partial [Diploptera punctata]
YILAFECGTKREKALNFMCIKHLRVVVGVWAPSCGWPKNLQTRSRSIDQSPLH